MNRCSQDIVDLFIGWKWAKNAWHGTLHCDCEECIIREIPQGTEWETWASTKRHKEMDNE